MFGKEKGICTICKQNKGEKFLSDGVICKDCIAKCRHFIYQQNWKSISAHTAISSMNAHVENQRRLSIYSKTKNIEKYLEIDEVNHFWKPAPTYPIVFLYEEIISFELLEDGETIIKGGLGSAIAGGVLLGGVGALVGGSVGAKKTKKEITQYGVKIITKHPFFPSVYINFLATGKVKTGSLIYKSYRASAHSVLSALSIITNEQTMSNAPVDATLSTADEITKFKKLLDDGIITQDEFDKKKMQLLNL